MKLNCFDPYFIVPLFKKNNHNSHIVKLFCLKSDPYVCFCLFVMSLDVKLVFYDIVDNDIFMWKTYDLDTKKEVKGRVDYTV